MKNKHPRISATRKRLPSKVDGTPLIRDCGDASERGPGDSTSKTAQEWFAQFHKPLIYITIQVPISSSLLGLDPAHSAPQPIGSLQGPLGSTSATSLQGPLGSTSATSLQEPFRSTSIGPTSHSSTSQKKRAYSVMSRPFVNIVL